MLRVMGRHICVGIERRLSVGLRRGGSMIFRVLLGRIHRRVTLRWMREYEKIEIKWTENLIKLTLEWSRR